MSAGGFSRDWPSGRAVFQSLDSTLQILMNGEDHFNITVIMSGAKLSEAFKKLENVLAKIEEDFKFARSSHLGYLTCCPTNLGTGMTLKTIV